MKKIKLSLIVAGFLFGLGINSASAQHDVKMNFLGLLFGNYGLGYENVLSDEMTVGATVNYYAIKLTSTNFDGSEDVQKWSGFNIAPEFRFYFAPDDEADGLYAGAYFKYRSVKSDGWYDPLSVDDTYKRNSGGALGIVFGRKWVADAGFIFETFAGIGKYLFESESYGTESAREYWESDFVDVTGLTSIDLRLGLSIGWRIGG